MNPILEYKLKRLGRRGKPSKVFVASLKQTLIERGAAPASIGFRLPMMKFASVALSVVLLLGVGTSTYAYASDEVTPDHPLYGVRQAVEVAEETIAITPAWKERVFNKNLGRKQKEIGLLLERDPELKERPEGIVLQKVESILKKGIEEKRDTDEIRKEALIEVRSGQNDREHPRVQKRLRQIEHRLENMKKMEEDD